MYGNHSTALSTGNIRAACYLLGPIAAAIVLRWRQYRDEWSVQFHAYYSMLMAGLWLATWLTLEIVQNTAPSWFFGTLVGEIQLITNLGFLIVWAALTFTAYRGDRFVAVPALHGMAVRLARRAERRREIQMLRRMIARRRSSQNAF